MGAIAKEVVRADTGEVVSAAVVPFDMATYLSDVKSAKHTSQQHALMAAYDAACGALIGPNDVQEEKGRTFKKKSAWRKLARHFGISVAASLESVRVERNESGFTAYAIANAVAPWGQSWTDVGACGSDEAVGRRVITVADAVATAMTRASNRAISNLIAMGEVSAEEIGERQAYDSGSRTSGAARDKKMPIGKKKGTRLGDLTVEDLSGTRDWCRNNDKEKGTSKWGGLIDALEEVIREKSSARSTTAPPSEFEEFPEALKDDEDDLPF